MRAILARFEEVSGLRINLGKSELVPIGVVHNMDVLVGMLGCWQSSLPLRYLGLSLGAKFKELSLWNPILEKMEWRLAGWKRLYLSKGGKGNKSTLSSLPPFPSVFIWEGGKSYGEVTTRFSVEWYLW